MTQLSPTALEAAAKAISVSTGDEPDKLTYAREMQCSGANREPQYRWQYWTEHATAAITAYLAQREKEGWVMVPSVPLACLRETDRKIRSIQNRGSDTTERLVQIECLLAWPNVQGLLAAAQNGGE